ncbi:MAG: hypothetical protein OEZ14_06425, partial [Acidimicrobiia bacterium]|nr:hypothetical protein [Acidimicrobiia bacterium]
MGELIRSSVRPRVATAISRASIARSARSEVEACQPITMRENTPMMNATYTHPVWVFTGHLHEDPRWRSIGPGRHPMREFPGGTGH